MFPEPFLSFTFLQKKKDILLYRAQDRARSYILKSIISKDAAVRQAFYDEYESLHNILSASVPHYYGIMEDFEYPDREGQYLTICMEDCFPMRSLSQDHYPISTLLEILHQTGNILLELLQNGILYTDLNPSNILISQRDSLLKVTLIDFTFCYYFKRNPFPDYPLRISYDLSPSLKGHQLLIQELALLLQAMIMDEEEENIPSSVWLLLETGLQPSESLLLPDYLSLLEKALV